MLSQINKFILAFSEKHLFTKIYEEIVSTTIEVKNEYLLNLIRENNQENPNDRDLVFLNSANVNRYIVFKESTIKRLLIGHIDYQNIFKDETSKIDKNANKT